MKKRAKAFMPRTVKADLPVTEKPFALRMHPDVSRPGQSPTLTPEQAWRLYAPPRTLGATEDHQLAMDAHLKQCGFHSLLTHAVNLGMGFEEMAPQFLGYPYLAGLSQNGLIRAGVTTVAEEMTKRWIEIHRVGDNAGSDAQGSGKDGRDRRVKALATAMEDFGIQSLFNEAAQKCDFDGGCLVYIDTGDDADLQDELFLDGALLKDRVKRFTLVEAVNLYPGPYNATDPLSPGYFVPQSWMVLGKRIHASRFLYFAPNKVNMLLRPAYNFFGIPAAQLALDYVAHFTKCREAAQRLLTKFSLTVFKSDMSQILSGGTAHHMDMRLAYLAQKRDNDSVLLIDKEREDVIKLETPLGGTTEIVRQSLEFLAAIFRIPFVKFLGISPGGLNATGEADLRNFYDHVGSKQEKILREPLNRVLDILQLHLFGEVDPEIRAVFLPLSDEDGAHKATTLKTEADRDAVYLDKGVLDRAEVRRKLSDTPESGYGFIDAKTLPESSRQENGPAKDMGAEGKETLKPGISAAEAHTSGRMPDAAPSGADRDGFKPRFTRGEETSAIASVAQDVRPSGIWKETEHPRDKDGKFTAGSGTSGGSGEEAEKDEGKEAEEQSGPTAGEKNNGLTDGLIKAENRIVANKGQNNPLDPATGTLVAGPAAANKHPYKRAQDAVETYAKNLQPKIPNFSYKVKTTPEEDKMYHEEAWKLHELHKRSPEQAENRIAAMSEEKRLKVLANYLHGNREGSELESIAENNSRLQLLLMGVPSSAFREMQKYRGTLRGIKGSEYYKRFNNILNALKIDYLPKDMHNETQIFFNKSHDYVKNNERLLKDTYDKWLYAKNESERYRVIDALSQHLRNSFGMKNSILASRANPKSPSTASTPVKEFLKPGGPQWVTNINIASPIFSKSSRENFLLAVSTLVHEMQHQKQAAFIRFHQEQQGGELYIKSSSLACNIISYIDGKKNDEIDYILQPSELQAHLLQRDFLDSLDKALLH